MAPLSSPDPYRFQAAVERHLSVAYQTPEGRWEGHDYRVEVVAERPGLDAFDVVMDFRDLETALDQELAPFQGRLLSDLGLTDPRDLVLLLAERLAPKVPLPARLAQLSLTDGRGHCITCRP